MSKTIFYIIAFSFCIQYNSKAQYNSSYQTDDLTTETIVKKNNDNDLKPVFYNFTQRRLYTNNKTPLNPKQFLELCRSINDPSIQEQIARYDQLTDNKKKLIGTMIFTGIAGCVAIVGSMAMQGTNGNSASMVAGLGSASLFILTPAIAISTTAPHQKRKEILFHDLPEAYNLYVTSKTNQ